MSEKLTAKEYAEKLLYTPEYAADKQADVKEKAAAFAEGYKKFMDRAKTEREAAVVSEQMLLAAGYKAFEPKKAYAPGEKVYFIQENKAVVAATIGQKPYEEGFRLVIAHIDCPRLDLRPNPLYESDHMSYFRTHYYGGVRKYQWATIPLAIHGVFTRADGSSVNFAIGEDENDPVFCITDLLPHLGAEQNERKLSEGIKGEELNVLIGSDTVEEEDVKEAVKLNTLILLNQKYGITERDFTRAEIEVVPAAKARDVGFDRSMIGAYGHDDRVDAYPALLAEIETKDPVHTTICVLTDKEEIGSDGVTGMQSMYVFHFMQLLCRAAGDAAFFGVFLGREDPLDLGCRAGKPVVLFVLIGEVCKGEEAHQFVTDGLLHLVGGQTRRVDVAVHAEQARELDALLDDLVVKARRDEDHAVLHSVHREDVCRMRHAEIFGKLRTDLRRVAVGGLLAADDEVKVACRAHALRERVGGGKHIRARKLAVAEHRAAHSAHADGFENHAFRLRGTHRNGLHRTAVRLDKVERKLDPVQVVGVHLACHAVALQHARDGIDLHIARTGDLLDAYKNIHTVPPFRLCKICITG